MCSVIHNHEWMIPIGFFCCFLFHRDLYELIKGTEHYNELLKVIDLLGYKQLRGVDSKTLWENASSEVT